MSATPAPTPDLCATTADAGADADAGIQADAGVPRRCGVCGYRLGGLPVAGRCPECGGEYDDAGGAVHLFGRGAGKRASRASATPWVAVPSLVFSAVWVVYMVQSWRSGTGNVLDTVVLLPVVVVVATSVLPAVWRVLRASDDDLPPTRAYLGPDGIGQVDGRPASANRPWRRDDSVAVAPARRWGGWRRSAGPGGNEVGAFRLRVLPAPPKPWWKRLVFVHESIDLTFDVTGDEADALLRRARAWRDAATVGELRDRPDGPPGHATAGGERDRFGGRSLARRAGRLVGALGARRGRRRSSPGPGRGGGGSAV